MSRYLLVLIVIQLLAMPPAMAQVTINPDCFQYSFKGLHVDKVELNSHNTILYITYQNKENFDVEISVDPYTTLKERNNPTSHAMIRFEGIEVSPSKTTVKKRKSISFQLYFPEISPGCTEVDLFTCPESGCINIKGIQIKNAKQGTTPQLKSDVKFQREYTFVCIYDPKKGKWGDWVQGSYLFVFNTNSNQDFKLYWDSDKILPFTCLKTPERMSEKDGRSFEYYEAKDKVGNKMSLKYYDNGEALLFYPAGEAYNFK